MNDAILQVLLILAFLAIGLISVTFPIYAISVNFLPQQKWENEKERKKRMDELKTRISELTAKLGGEAKSTETEIKEQLRKYEVEKEGTELKYKYLTAWGAVGIPVGFLILALLSAGIGIYGFVVESETGVIGWGGLSAIFSFAAIIRLYKTISAVEYGALRPERTVEFDVGFSGGKYRKTYEKTKNIKTDEQISIEIRAKTRDVDAENFFLQISLPPDIRLLATKTPHEGIIISRYEDLTIIALFQDYLPKDVGTGLTIPIIVKKVGTYTIDVRVCAKGIYESRKELTLEVV